MPNFVFSDNEEFFNLWKDIADALAAPPFSGTFPNAILEDNLYIWQQMSRVVGVFAGGDFIPLSGTTAGHPVTGIIVFQTGSPALITSTNGVWQFKVANQFIRLQNSTITDFIFMDNLSIQLQHTLDIDFQTGHDLNENVGNDKTVVIANDLVETIQGDASKNVTGDLNDTILNDSVENVGRNKQINVNNTYTENILGDRQVNIGIDDDEVVNGNKGEVVVGSKSVTANNLTENTTLTKIKNIGGNEISAVGVDSTENIGNRKRFNSALFAINNLQEFPNNAAAVLAGLQVDDLYRTTVLTDAFVKIVI